MTIEKQARAILTAAVESGSHPIELCSDLRAVELDLPYEDILRYWERHHGNWPFHYDQVQLELALGKLEATRSPVEFDPQAEYWEQHYRREQENGN